MTWKLYYNVKTKTKYTKNHIDKVISKKEKLNPYIELITFFIRNKHLLRQDKSINLEVNFRINYKFWHSSLFIVLYNINYQYFKSNLL